MPGGPATTNRRKRNLLLAGAILLLGLSFLFAPGEEGMLWMMWRDATWLAVLFVAIAAVLVVLWWRTPQN
jgi:hypothetical protein